MLYIIGSPIGNLKDITYRAIEILSKVDIIFCEDTRITSRLLRAYNIEKKLISCNAKTERDKVKKLIQMLSEGLEIAYLSDAGTPSLSDPGSFLVKIALENNFKVVPIPGVSSFNTLVSLNPFNEKTITFEGFLPNKGEKRFKRINELYKRSEAFVLLESNHRILKLLEECSRVDENMQILLGREMTKIYEEYIVGSPNFLIKHLKDKIKGEFTLLIARNKIKS